jgi:hypothetical protein
MSARMSSFHDLSISSYDEGRNVPSQTVNGAWKTTPPSTTQRAIEIKIGTAEGRFITHYYITRIETDFARRCASPPKK